MSVPIDQPEKTVVASPRQGPQRDPLPSGPAASAGDDVEVTVLADLGPQGTVVRAAQRCPGLADTASLPQAQGPACPQGLDLLGTIGEGAMGQVLLARDRILRRKVAFKRLRAELRQEPEIAQRLLAEAQITAQLDHPNVVPLHSLVQDHARPLGYVMKLVEGETLAALIEQARAAVGVGRPLSPALRRESLLEHFLKVCDAVAFAHAKGVIHRDLKPANIMVGRFNEVYVMDWGIARVMEMPDLLPASPEERVHCVRESADPGTDATVVGTLIGTPKYMSPEQARGEIDRLDPRSDLYSLGLILYELVCLRPAFGGPDFGTVLDRVRRGERAPISAPSSRLAVPRELRAIVEKATRAEPRDRYPDLAALARDLRSFLRGESVRVLRDTSLRRTLRWIGRHRQAALNLFLATLLLAALATGALWYRHTAAMERIHDRRELTMHFFDLASARAHHIVQYFTRTLGLLEGLSVGAELALEQDEATQGRIYTVDDFGSSSARPADAAPTRHSAGLPISTEHPVVVLPKGGMDPGTDLKVGRLVALTPLFQRIFLEANGERDGGISGSKVRVTLDDEDIEIDWLGVALREGAMVGYPGSADYPDDYDPTQRPWYLQALTAEGTKACGDPYADAGSNALVMSCSVALYSREGELLGVAGLDLPLAHGVARLLVARDLPQVRALLLNDRGQILVEVGTGRAGSGAVAGTLPTYEDETLVDAVRGGRSGLLERVDGRRSLWVIYIYLPELNWTYVAELLAWGREEPG